MAARHLRHGRHGEAAARDYLKGRGYRILEENWRTRRGELDIVCSHKGVVVFVEVKTRSRDALGAPGEAVTREKQQRLVRAASVYLSRNDLWDKPCRFDLISVVMSEDGPEVEHSIDVFQFTDPVGRGNTAWQPW